MKKNSRTPKEVPLDSPEARRFLARGDVASDHLEQEELQRAIALVMKTLSPQEQAVVRGRMGGQSFAGMARKTGVSDSSIEGRYDRAIRKLQHPIRSSFLERLAGGGKRYTRSGSEIPANTSEEYVYRQRQQPPPSTRHMTEANIGSDHEEKAPVDPVRELQSVITSYFADDGGHNLSLDTILNKMKIPTDTMPGQLKRASFKELLENENPDLEKINLGARDLNKFSIVVDALQGTNQRHRLLTSLRELYSAVKRQGQEASRI